MSKSVSGEQRTVHFEGHVQGVGFRFTTESLAKSFAVTGYVQNLSDGRVKLVAEGAPPELDAFERRLQERLGDYIHHATRDVQPATGQFTDFSIRY